MEDDDLLTILRNGTKEAQELFDRLYEEDKDALAVLIIDSEEYIGPTGEIFINDSDLRLLNLLADKGIDKMYEIVGVSMSLLSAAAKYGNYSLVKFFISKNASLNAPDDSVVAPLHMASVAGDLDIVMLLISRELILGPYIVAFLFSILLCMVVL